MKYGLDEIKTFLAVVESGSISGAATRLAIAKSVVSQRVAYLEAALGVEPLRRSSRGVTPTDRGRVFHEQSCAAIAQLEHAAEAVTDDEAALSGLLRISVPMTFGTQYLSPILCEFMRAHPRLELALDLSDRMVDVAAEGYDLAIRITRIKEDSLLVARKLADSRRVVCCSPNYANERGLPKTLAELPQHAGIGYARLAANHLWQFAPARRKAQPHILTTSFEAGPNGPPVPELKETFPKAPYITRPGNINAWDNEDFVKAVKATGKKQLIIAGVVTEVCVAFPALSAIEKGYDVFVITDASGTFNEVYPPQRLVADAGCRRAADELVRHCLRVTPRLAQRH